MIQAANTGLTSIQKLVDSAKSVANQALQATIGYSTKSNVSTTITGATSADLRGTSTLSNAQSLSNTLKTGTSAALTGSSTLGASTGGTFTGAAVLSINTGTPAITSATKLFGAATTDSLTLTANTAFKDGDTLTVNGKSVAFKNGTAPLPTSLTGANSADGQVVFDDSGNSTVYLSDTTSVSDVLKAIDVASGVRKVSATNGSATVTDVTALTESSVDANGKVSLLSTKGGDLNVSGKADILKALGLTTTTGSGVATVSATRPPDATALSNLISDGSTLNVNGKTITFKDGPVPTASSSHTGVISTPPGVETDATGNSTVYLRSATADSVLAAIDLATGVRTATLGSTGASIAATSPSVPVSSVVNSAL